MELPVGSLTSQLSANLYLNIIDQIIVNRYGFGKYVRYMDDTIIICKDKNEAREVLRIVNEEVIKIGLRLNPKSNYFPVERGVDYVGYRIFTTHILARKRIIKNVRNNLKELNKQYHDGLIDFEFIRPKLASFIGFAKHCRSSNTINRIIDEFLYNLEL